MKYDIVTELKAKGLINRLDSEENNALRYFLCGVAYSPNSVEVDSTFKTVGFIKSPNNVTSIEISDGGRNIKSNSNPKNKDNINYVLIELLPAGLCNFTINKYSDNGFRVIRFRTSIKPNFEFHQLEIRYYDSEAVKYYDLNRNCELSEENFKSVGIIPDVEELLQLPHGIKGRDEIFKYIALALGNPDDAYSVVAEAMAVRGRIGRNPDEDVLYLDSENNIAINRNNKNLKRTFAI